jgi:hypothetical protein
MGNMTRGQLFFYARKYVTGPCDGLMVQAEFRMTNRPSK